jgi:hypothetical protein
MGRMMRRAPAPLACLAAAVIALGALAGCARPFVLPLPPPPFHDQVPAAYDATWRALIRALAAENVPLRTVARDSGVISSDEITSPIGVYADCGRLGAVALEGDALVTFTMFVQANGSGDTDVQINYKMRTQGWRRGDTGGLSYEPIYPCTSTGRWEANLMDTLRRLVKE